MDQTSYSMLIIPPLFKLKLQSDNLYWKVFVVVICVCWYQFEMFLSKSNWEASKSGECTRITRPFQRGKQMGHAGQSCWIHLMVVCCAHNNAAKMAFCKLNIQTFGPEQHSSFAPPNFFKVTTLTDLHPTLILLWKKPSYFPSYRLFNRDPYNCSLSAHNWAVFHPPKIP